MWLTAALLLAAMATRYTEPAHTAVEGQRHLAPQTAAQRAALRSTAPEFCYSGRRFGGKSWVLCVKALAYAQSYDGARVAICRKERASMEATTLVTLRDEVVPREFWNAFWSASKSCLELPNRSAIQVFGLDDPGRALGARYGFVGVDQAEQLDENQFEIINSCVMQVGMPFQQTFLAFNPEHPEHWAYHRYKPDNGDGARYDARGQHFADVVHVSHDDLIGYLSDTARQRFDRMDGTLAQRLRHGLWVAHSGSVYEHWAPAVHIVPAPESWAAWGGYPPPDWARGRAIDFGYEHPWVCLWFATSPEGRDYLYRQEYATRLTIGEQCARIRADEAAELAALRAACPAERAQALAPYLDELNLETSYSDHESGHRAQYDAEGVWTQPADKDILAGIESVREALDPRFGPPSLVVVAGSLAERDARLAEDRKAATCLEEELPRYRWRRLKTVTDASKGTELPVDRDNHALDALRYHIHSRAARVPVRVWA